MLDLLFDSVKNGVEFIFGDSITHFREDNDGIDVAFSNGSRRSFDLVFGCDGVRSDVRKLWFGSDDEFSHFLGAYGSITIVDKLLIPVYTSQMYNEPGASTSWAGSASRYLIRLARTPWPCDRCRR